MKMYKFWIQFHWSLFPSVKFDNIPALFQKMAWRRPGEKQLSEPMMIIYWCIYAPLALNEFKQVDIFNHGNNFSNISTYNVRHSGCSSNSKYQGIDISAKCDPLTHCGLLYKKTGTWLNQAIVVYSVPSHWLYSCWILLTGDTAINFNEIWIKLENSPVKFALEKCCL